LKARRSIGTPVGARGTLGNGSWGYIVGSYDKDAGPNNERLYLNGTRVGR
jgi:hypothetical protein